VGDCVEASVIIRTLNEARWLPKLLEAISQQDIDGRLIETVIVDSGSTDDTLSIAKDHGCRVVHIRKEDFTFGRSLNVGCDAALGRCLIFISGHCIPVGTRWLADLIAPLQEGAIEYVYGRQEGFGPTKYSERQLFKKYYPMNSQLPRDDIFCNNANSALLKSAWKEFPFDESLTGLEDMDLAKRLLAAGRKIGYVAESSVLHIHDETWKKVKIRYEREAIALRNIRPEFHVGLPQFIRYFLAGVYWDCRQAIKDRVLHKYAIEIVLFRFMQYFGTYCGNNEHRQLSGLQRDAYFYPK